ncbi:hypothetical protein C1646_814691 [Rhizophagus diaphanus]|nr:hypothetical protein C1646_814691 [Rhizophagus diaphanus] [Rhizophagus sp. MUCL 43196]
MYQTIRRELQATFLWIPLLDTHDLKTKERKKKKKERKETSVDESLLIDQVDQVRTGLNELQSVIGNQIPEQENQLFKKIFDILNLIEEFEAGKQLIEEKEVNRKCRDFVGRFLFKLSKKLDYDDFRKLSDEYEYGIFNFRPISSNDYSYGVKNQSAYDAQVILSNTTVVLVFYLRGSRLSFNGILPCT